jgi:hypothetical protein
MLTMRPVIVELGLSKTCAKVLPELLRNVSDSVVHQTRTDLLANNAAHDALVISKQQETTPAAKSNGGN